MDKHKHKHYNERVGNADAMKHERAIILFAIIALLVGIPAGVFFRQKAELIESQMNQRKQLERSIEQVQAELESKSHDSNTKASEIERLQREKSELEIKLQSRIDAKKIEVVARAQANEQPVVSKPPVVAVAPTNNAEAEAKAFIYFKESGNRTDAINKSSGACGLGQALPCSKLPCTLTDYACQDAWFTKYMQNRYGTWVNAKAFWLRSNWW